MVNTIAMTTAPFAAAAPPAASTAPVDMWPAPAQGTRVSTAPAAVRTLAGIAVAVCPTADAAKGANRPKGATGDEAFEDPT